MCVRYTRQVSGESIMSPAWNVVCSSPLSPLLPSSSLIRFSPPPLQIQAACSRIKKNLTKLETSWTQTKQKAKEREKKEDHHSFRFCLWCVWGLSLSLFLNCFETPHIFKQGRNLNLIAFNAFLPYYKKLHKILFDFGSVFFCFDLLEFPRWCFFFSFQLWIVLLH